jgi:hypothetical protein
VESVAELLERFQLFLAGLPRNERVALFVLAGLSLTYLAIPRFDEEVLTALLFIALAVFFFWMAIGAFF